MDSILLIIAALLATAPILYFIFKKSGDNEPNRKNSGSITLFTEASCRQAVEALIRGFEKANPNAQIGMRWGTEKEAFEALLNDTSRLVVLPRTLSEKEKQIFASKYFTPPGVEFARDLKTGNMIRPFVLYNNQASIGLGRSFMGFVVSEQGNQIIANLGLETVNRKKEGSGKQRRVA